MPETMTLDSAVNFLKENGYPTSKGKLYKLTSKKEVPHFKYGHKLVFSRSDLLEWAKNQLTRQMTEEERNKRANFIIINDEKHDLYSQMSNILSLIKRKHAE